MILVIDICAERLHSLEFVKPIEDILIKSNYRFFTKHYSEVTLNDIKRAKKIMICGTSLKDNQFINHIKNFDWIKTNDKPVLGICGGMHIIGKLFWGNLRKATEIGFYDEFFQNFLGIKGKQQVYHLHNYYINFRKMKDFDLFSKGKIPQAVKHKHKEIYGVLFHPEVRQKNLIIKFVEN